MPLVLGESLQPLDIQSILFGLIGGLALFLYGMDSLTQSLKNMSGNGLHHALSFLTTNRFTAVLAGASITAIIQSSSVTTVLLVGFVASGLLAFEQSIAVIMGANIGTTITAQMIAFDVTGLALLFIAMGFGLRSFFKQKTIKQAGIALLALGLIFLGMDAMGQATSPLRTSPSVLAFFKQVNSPLIGIFLGAAFTALVQSSSATTGIVIVFASQGMISLSLGIALLFGANIGTCFTAWLAALGKSQEAKRAMFAHVLFNIGGVLLFFFFIPSFKELILMVSPSSNHLSGVARLAADTPRQIANAHTIFNVLNTLIFIGLIHPIARIASWVFPNRKEDKSHKIAHFLDDSLLDTPTLAIDATRLTLAQMGTLVEKSLTCISPLALKNRKNATTSLKTQIPFIKSLHNELVSYMASIMVHPLDKKTITRLRLYLSTSNSLESIAETSQNTLLHFCEEPPFSTFQPSKKTEALLSDFHNKVSDILSRSLQLSTLHQEVQAPSILENIQLLEETSSPIESMLATHLATHQGASSLLYQDEHKLLESLQRILYFSKKIAHYATFSLPETTAPKTKLSKKAKKAHF